MQFPVEKIEVEGNRRVPAEIVVSQSLLVPGRSYPESELRNALHRVQRLPFILDVDMRLDKGSERGHYALVILVRETSRLFYSSALTFSYTRNTFPLLQPQPDGTVLGEGAPLGNSTTAGVSDVTLGSRFFVGRDGVAFVALDNGLAAGYTLYNLFGHGAFVTAGVRAGSFSCCRLFYDDSDQFPDSKSVARGTLDGNLELSLMLGVPLRGNHTLQVGARRIEASSANLSSSSSRLEARWIRDTTDDPLLPFSGGKLSAGTEVSRDSGSAKYLVFETQEDSVSLFADAMHHFPLGNANALSLRGDAAYRRSDVRQRGSLPLFGELDLRAKSNLWSISAGIADTQRLWQRNRFGTSRVLRWEVSLDYRYSRAPSFVPRYASSEQLSFETGLAYRDRFGIVRLTLAYQATHASSP